MSLLGNIGKIAGGIVSAPFKAVAAVAKAVTPAATELLRGVMNTGFDLAKTGANFFSSLGPVGYIANPMMALAGPLLGQGIQGLQNATNQGLTSFNSLVQGRPVPFSPYDGNLQLPPFDQRMGSPYGIAGQYGSQMINQQLGNMPMFSPEEQALLSRLPPDQQQQFIAQRQAQFAPQLGPQFGGLPQQFGPIAQQFGATAGGVVGAGAGVIPTGLNPAGNSNTDLVNTIATAPLFSPDEAALMKNLPPEQQAMMTLQAKKQRESLMTSILTNIANMKHESLKGIANNLRG